jgi:hypothetical protein
LYGTTPLNSSYLVYGINGYGFLNTGWGSASNTVSGTGVTGDVIGLALDIDAKTLQFYKNGSSIGTISGFTFVENWSIGISCNATVSTPWVFNFGQRAFAYTAPSGYKALCTSNLPEPTIADGSQYFDTDIWSGNSTQDRKISTAFSPGFVWVKRRSGAKSHILIDKLRGDDNYLHSDTTNANQVQADLLGLVSDGYELGSVESVNLTNSTYVGWAWDAGTSTVTNNDGSIASQVRANPSAGFSIVSYTADGTVSTIGHGLNAAPQLIIGKSRTGAYNWMVGHEALGFTKFINLNSTNAAATSTDAFANTAPTSSVFTIGSNNNQLNTNGGDYIAYCFAPVEGYSAMGSYEGNGSATNGPFVALSFAPAFLLLKSADVTGGWALIDSTRDSSNAANALLQPNRNFAEAESSVHVVDLLSNGFKLRGTGGSDPAINPSSTVLYAAFAEHPFKTARAR